MFVDLLYDSLYLEWTQLPNLDLNRTASMCNHAPIAPSSRTHIAIQKEAKRLM